MKSRDSPSNSISHHGWLSGTDNLVFSLHVLGLEDLPWRARQAEPEPEQEQEPGRGDSEITYEQ